MPAGWLSAPPGVSSGPHTGGPNVRIVVKELESLRRHRSSLILALIAVGATLGAAGCGESESSGSGPPDYAEALAGSPPRLAALYGQGDSLLGGGGDAYEARVAELRGFPVVTNVWASWCGPCRFEFPFFQRAAARYGKRVGFLGIDKEDDDDAARTFLREQPIPYPSYKDPDGAISAGIGASFGMPDTAFYDSSGELVFLKQGPYDDYGELRDEIERYALGREPKGG